MNREELLNKVRGCTPYLGWEYKYPDLFGKYGYSQCGIGDRWCWHEEDMLTQYARENGCKALSEATDMELLEMWAIMSDYWYNEYKGWNRTAEEKTSILDRFIGKCERDYFGYEKEYTPETINKILNSVIEILDSHFKKE